jgi:hypothetical protein
MLDFLKAGIDLLDEDSGKKRGRYMSVLTA